MEKETNLIKIGRHKHRTMMSNIAKHLAAASPKTSGGHRRNKRNENGEANSGVGGG